jgi:hypothetical protein
MRSFQTATYWPGIREKGEAIQRFYVALRPPEVLPQGHVKTTSSPQAQPNYRMQRAQRSSCNTQTAVVRAR